MVTFCIGSSGFKRRMFRSMANGTEIISIDNDEVLATFTLNKKLFCVVGDIPYGNMSLEQYIACSRSLITKLPLKRNSIKLMLKKAGLKCSPAKKLKRLTRIEYRIACLVAKLDIATKTIYINFDGLEFTRGNRNQINKLLSIWSKSYEIFVAVSDSRFITKKSKVLNYTKEGIIEKEIKMRNKPISVSNLKKKLKFVGMDINLPNIKSVVVCDM